VFGHGAEPLLNYDDKDYEDKDYDDKSDGNEKAKEEQGN